MCRRRRPWSVQRRFGERLGGGAARRWWWSRGQITPALELQPSCHLLPPLFRPERKLVEKSNLPSRPPPPFPDVLLRGVAGVGNANYVTLRWNRNGSNSKHSENSDAFAATAFDRSDAFSAPCTAVATVQKSPKSLIFCPKKSPLTFCCIFILRTLKYCGKCSER